MGVQTYLKARQTKTYLEWERGIYIFHFGYKTRSTTTDTHMYTNNKNAQECNWQINEQTYQNALLMYLKQNCMKHLLKRKHGTSLLWIYFSHRFSEIWIMKQKEIATLLLTHFNFCIFKRKEKKKITICKVWKKDKTSRILASIHIAAAMLCIVINRVNEQTNV